MQFLITYNIENEVHEAQIVQLDTCRIESLLNDSTIIVVSY